MKTNALVGRSCLFFLKILLAGFTIGALGGCAQKTGDAAWKKYYDLANAKTPSKELIADVTLKIEKIADEKSTTDRARAYADCSVSIAKYWRDNCNWLDGQDTTVKDGDTGRGVSDWHGHYLYMRGQPPKPAFGKFVESRMLVLEKGLTSEQFSRVYADVSVILDQYLVAKTEHN